MKRLAAPLVALVILNGSTGPLLAANGNELEQAEARSRLDQVTRAITELSEQLQTSRDDHRKEQQQLRQQDLAIQQANRNYKALEQQRQAHMDELGELQARREDYLSSLDERQERLAGQLRSSYRLGGQSRMKLILNQDDPAQMSRMLAYYDYVNRAQIEQISGLREALTTLEGMQQSIDRELMRIEDVQNEQHAVLDSLQRQRKEREILLARLSLQIDGEASRLRELEQNRSDLEALLQRLENVLSDIPADLGKRVGIASQRGRIPMPVKGPVIHAFGQNRTGGLKWQGWLIGAGTGTEVGAIGYGRVAFADWLRGYGFLMIIDHGQGYLSLYGHNESLFREAGAWVEPGEVISVVGGNPGSGQGLYFELRKNGKALDPASWLTR